ncbi:hypothetical protein Rhopal_002366-T1 [Rhodotorula paludigena]|uniref:Uncharacterized protein n=1 Tax=Rhodotorula paludigena TaxID=86838 RepID=A0AAV5G9V4_9BASI|nr:hypothetical protein Rhopal_002366-T1 [Rhodotorula paludigena]
MDWELIAGPSGAQPVAGPSGAQSSAAINLTMSSSPDDAQLTWPTDFPAAQQSCQPLKQSSSEDNFPILKSLSPSSRLLLDTTITIRDQSLDNLNGWSLVGAIANPNIADAKRNALVQELRARTRHGVLRLSPGEINVTSLPSSSAPSTIGAEDNLIDFSPGPFHFLERHDETLLKVSESTYVAVKDVKGKSKDIKGKGKATEEEPTTMSIKITRTTLDPTGARQRLTAKHPIPPAPREEEARKLKDVIAVLYDVYVRMRGKMKKSRSNAADEDVIAASAMIDGKASESAKRRFRRIDHAASSAAALVARFFSVVRGTGTGQGMQSQTAKQGDPQNGVIKKMVDKVAFWWGKGNPSTLQKYSAEALTLSLRDTPKMLAVDHPHLATQPSNVVVNASTYDDVVSHPSFQPPLASLRASALSIATQMSAHGCSVNDITHMRLLYTLLPDLDRDIRAALAASRTSVGGRTPVTAGLCPIADDEAIGANTNAVSTLWTGVAHRFLKEKIKEELARLNTAGLVVQPDQVTFNKSRSGLAFYARSGSPTAKLAVGILTQQQETVSLTLLYRVTNSSMPLLCMKRGALGDASILISEQLAGGKNTIQSGAVSVYFTDADEKNDGCETFTGELATDPALGHLFLMAVYTCAEDLPEPGSSQRVRDKAQQFFGTKGHVQDVISIIQQTYRTEFDRLITLLSSCAVSLQPAGTGFPNTFSGPAGLDALHLCARLLAKFETHISSTAKTSAVVNTIAKLTSQFNYALICMACTPTPRDTTRLFEKSSTSVNSEGKVPQTGSQELKQKLRILDKQIRLVSIVKFKDVKASTGNGNGNGPLYRGGTPI